MNTNQNSQMMTQSRERALEDHCIFRSIDRTSGRTSSGSYLQSVLLLSFSLLVVYWLFQNDFVGWYRSLPVVDQCMWASAFALFSLGFAATVREAYKDAAVRWTALGIGAVGVGFLIAFSWRVSVENEQLQNQLIPTTPPSAANR